VLRLPAPITHAAPIPELCCTLNVVYHEYCFVREQARDDTRFPAVDWLQYVYAIAHDIHLCGNPQVREHLFAQLRARAGADLLGWTPPAAPPRRSGLKSAWDGIARTVRSALVPFGVRPLGDPTFKDVPSALVYADRTAPEYVPVADHVLYMQRGWKRAG
jgi:hypothetical protein